MTRIYQRFATLVLLVVSLPVLALLPGEAEDGGPLHDQFYLGCHVSMFRGDDSAIYLRSERRVNSIEGLMGQVAFCNEQINVGLNEYEIDDIVAYVNESYYQFETDQRWLIR